MGQSPKTNQGGASLSNKEDSAAYTISASSLTIEVEAVTHALRWIASRGDSRTTRAIIVTDSMSLQQKVTVEWEAQTECVDGRHPPSTAPVGVLPWTCRSEGKRPSR